MSNAPALLQAVTRELRSPVCWLVVGVFALLSGGAFVVSLNAFLDESSQALSAPPLQPIDVNQLLIRPYLIQLGLAAILVLPLLTVRAYRQKAGAGALEPEGAGEDQSVLATFLGACSVYALMLLISAAPVVALFAFGTPEWRAILCGYVGLALAGAAFIAVAQFVASLSTTATAAGIATFALSCALAASSWLAWWGAPGIRPVLRHVSAGEVLNDFARGIVDTGHVVSYLTIITLGLYLTRRTRQPPRPS